MDLAARIAEDSEPLSDSSSSVTSPTGLAAIFMETGRMAELVDILARASVCLATSDEKEMEAHRGKSSSKPRKGGGSTCLWRVPGLGTDVERHYHKMGKKFPNSKYAKGSKGKLDS